VTALQTQLVEEQAGVFQIEGRLMEVRELLELTKIKEVEGDAAPESPPVQEEEPT
jgi:hypothetical protein